MPRRRKPQRPVRRPFRQARHPAEPESPEDLCRVRIGGGCLDGNQPPVLAGGFLSRLAAPRPCLPLGTDLDSGQVVSLALCRALRSAHR